MIDPITALAFSVYENKGVYALLLGSGVSRAAYIPTGWEVTLDLIKRVAALEGVTGDRSCTRISSRQKKRLRRAARYPRAPTMPSPGSCALALFASSSRPISTG